MGTQARLDLVGIGEAMVLFQAPFGETLEEASACRVDVAGAELNVCATLARFGARTALLTRVGDDPSGRRVLRAMRDHQVDTSLVALDERCTGALIRETLHDGERRVSYHRTGSAASGMDASDAQRIPVAGAPAMLLVSGLTAALGSGPRAAMRAAIDRCGEATAVVVDANLRPSLGNVDESLAFLRSVLGTTAILLLGDDEAEALFGTREVDEVFRVAAAAGVRETVLKAGPGGVWFQDGHGRIEHQRSLARSVVDPVGAGDAFCGAYLAARSRGVDVRGAVVVASRVAAQVVETMGDLDGLPSRQQAARMLVEAGV